MPEPVALASDVLATALLRGMQAQLAGWRATVQSGGHRLGWKIGFGDRASQQRMGLAAPVLGFLRRDRLLASGGIFPIPEKAVIKAEVEVAVRIGQDVANGATEAEAEAAIAAFAPAIEIVDISQPLDGLEALLRGNLYHAAVLIGTETAVTADAPCQSIHVRLHVNGNLMQVSEPFRLPACCTELVRLVANTLSQHGERLAAGDWIICGAIIEPCAVTPGNRLEVDMPSFGRIALGFSGPMKPSLRRQKERA